MIDSKSSWWVRALLAAVYLIGQCGVSIAVPLSEGPCFPHIILDASGSTFNTYINLDTTFGAYEAVMTDDISSLNDLWVCYHASPLYSYFFTAIKSTSPVNYYLMKEPGSTTAMFELDTDSIDDSDDQRAHKNRVSFGWGLSIAQYAFKSPLIEGGHEYYKLHGKLPTFTQPYYKKGRHWWLLLPYFSYLGEGLAEVFINWMDDFENLRSGCDTSQTRRMIFARNGDVKFRTESSLIGDGDWLPKDVFAASEDQLNVAKLQVLVYTAYTGVVGSSPDSANFTTRTACVFKDYETGHYLTATTDGSSLHVIGYWNSISTPSIHIEYGEVKAVNFNEDVYQDFRQANRILSKQVLKENVKDQQHADGRFFYVVDVPYHPGYYRLQLANQPKYYLAVLKVNGFPKLVATKLSIEEPGLITYLFKFPLPYTKGPGMPPILNVTHIP